MMEMTTQSTVTPPIRVKLEDIEAQQVDEGEDTKKQRGTQAIINRVVEGAAVGCIVLNILATIFFTGGVVIVAGIIGIVLGGGVVFFQCELENEDCKLVSNQHVKTILPGQVLPFSLTQSVHRPSALRTVQNDLRHQVNNFSDENNKLTDSVNRLESELVPLKETEAKLEAIAVKSGSTVEKLKELIKSNQITLDQMKATLADDVLASMVNIVLDSEASGDGKFSEKEIQKLILRLKMLPTIQMNEERFKEKLATMTDSKHQLACIMRLMDQIQDDDVPEEERVFKLSGDALKNVV